MDVDEEDDFYGDEGAGEDEVKHEEQAEVKPVAKTEAIDEDLEEGEEEDDEDAEDSDSDIDIITERKDGTTAAPPSKARYNEIRNIPQRTASSDIIVKKAEAKKESTPKPSGADLPGIATSKIDVNAKPVYPAAGKPITQVNIDDDLPDNEKPWRRPGTDISDYFNYGFDEFTWALYAAKQDSLRGEYDQDKIAQNQKKMMEDMNMMMSMGGGMPGMPALPGAGAGMPGMDGMPPEMAQMMQQMMAQGVDPSQMDPSAMFAAMSGGQAIAGQAGGNAQGAFGGQQGFGQGQEGFGYGQNMGAAANRGNFRGRGRGRGHQGW